MPCPRTKNSGVRRQALLRGAGALLFAPLLLGRGGGKGGAASGTAVHNTRLVLLGTTGGMTWWPGSDRASASQALVVGDAVYLVDLGFGATRRLAEAFNRGHFVTYKGQRTQLELSTFLNDVRAVFFTHLHMDHLGDYPTFLEIGARAGYAERGPLPIIGPGPRGRLEENHSGYTGAIIEAGCAGPGQPTPTPGTARMTDLLLQAFAQNFNDCARDEGYPDLTKILDVREIGDPATIPWPTGFTPPDPARAWTRDDTCPAMEPFEIFTDDRVRVTAVLVDHYQVYPSFAFRFDTEDGSLVLSGDTGPDTSGNLQKLARGADVLVHEVIDELWIEATFRGVKEGDPAWPLYKHVISAHTSTKDVGEVAASCGVETLVLSHIAPGNTPTSRLRLAQRNFPGRLVIGQDLLEVGIGKPRRRARG